MNLARNIRTGRKNVGFTQDELATILSIPTREIVDWEDDKSIPTDMQLIYLSRILDIPCDVLIHGNIETEVSEVKIDIRAEKLL